MLPAVHNSINHATARSITGVWVCHSTALDQSLLDTGSHRSNGLRLGRRRVLDSAGRVLGVTSVFRVAGHLTVLAGESVSGEKCHGVLGRSAVVTDGLLNDAELGLNGADRESSILGLQDGHDCAELLGETSKDRRDHEHLTDRLLGQTEGELQRHSLTDVVINTLPALKGEANHCLNEATDPGI
jgi:hypothetical protein